MSTEPHQTSTDEEDVQPRIAGQGNLSFAARFRNTSQPETLYYKTQVNDDFYKIPEYVSTGSYDRLQKYGQHCLRSEDFDRKELCNFGRVPLNWDFDADRARPLPSNDEGTYGGGARLTRGIEVEALNNNGSEVNGAFTLHVSTRGNEARVLSNESHVNGASTTHVSTRGNQVPVLSYESYLNGASTPDASPKRVKLSKQKPTHRVNRSVKVTQKTEVNDGFYKRVLQCSSSESFNPSLKHTGFSGPSEDLDKKEFCNYGRVPLNWDFDADRARPLPSSNEGTYGGGARLTRGIEGQTLSNGSQHVNGASTSQVAPKRVKLSKQKPTHLVNRSVTVTPKKIGCFSWF